jgi:hypothetical protein
MYVISELYMQRHYINRQCLGAENACNCLPIDLHYKIVSIYADSDYAGSSSNASPA